MLKSKWTYFFMALSVSVFLFFLVAVTNGQPLDFDRYLSKFFTELFSESTHPFFEVMDKMGSKIGVGIITLAFLAMLWLRYRNYEAMAAVVFAVTAGNEVNKWLKEAVGRPRPDQEHLVDVSSLSFPSGHAMIGMILYASIAYFIITELNKASAKWITGIIAGVWIFFMGISRIVMGVHYPSDIAAGFAAGYIWVFISISFYVAIKSIFRRKSYERKSA
ncbi:MULTISPECIES: phosphatase PAP2 family protein [Cytobacillus]|uniref:phosphatase PAP2 family protein n=1 Tax=Cytobacillus TaxID=2675230 RepID=UPI00203B728B|nr:phosphatase PAP2 family protein [Cytobacillus firmus]MCM3708350.1 phosphatase PAP2 family protein [Cytobacillus firmus]